MHPSSGELSPTSAVFHILLALADGERHGVGITKEVGRRTEGKVGPESLFRLLSSIEGVRELGLIEVADTRPDLELDRSRRRYYRLTALGRRLVAGELERLASLAEPMGPQPGQERLQPVLVLDPKYADAFNDEIAVMADSMVRGNPLAALWMHVRKYDEAESVLRRDIETYPEAPQPLLSLGIILLCLGRYANAVEALSKLLRLRPHWLSSHVYLGVALLENGQLAEGQMHLERATGCVGRVQALANLYLGKLYAQRGEVAKAAAAWKTYLEKDSDSPSARRVRELLTELDRLPQP